MMSLYRTMSQGEAGATVPEPGEAGGAKRWGRYLPAAGWERKAFVGLAVLVLGLKALTIYHYRADADETQHAHMVWEWATGHLQYRDFFDNHMPVFQVAMAPVMRLIGERADIMVWLRWAVLPIYFACLWCVFRLAERLYSGRIAPWMCLAAAAMPKFFYTSTEFRPDDLWALCWLAALLAAVSGPFTVRRAFGFGLILGLTFAVSLKTVVLTAALLTATLVAAGLAWMRGEGPKVLGGLGRAGVALVGTVIPVAATVGYFAWRGAFWIMYYCVVSHNVVPRMKRWGHFSVHEWIFPASVAVLGGCAWLIFRQTRDTHLAMRRAIIALTPWFFLCLLLSYWPDITREDDLPYTPLTPFLAIPLITWFAGRFKMPKVEARFFSWVAPAVIFAELLCIWNMNPLRTDRLKVTTRSIADVLRLTDKNDYVMDGRGDYIFRQRAYYWVFETITKARMRLGLIPDDLPKALEKKEVKVCYLFSAHVSPATTQFILSNYISFDPEALDLAVAGKELGGADGIYSFDVAIPGTYAVVSETGTTAGTLDGASYSGPVRIEAGRHEFRRSAGSGRVAIFMDRALAEGFHPLFDVSEKFMENAKTAKEE